MAATAAVGVTAFACVPAFAAPPRPGTTVAAQRGALPADLPACPFWDPSVTPPPRTDTPWVQPPQTAPAVDFSSRMAAPGLSGTLVNGQVQLTVARVSGAVAYRIWRDGVAVAWVSDWGQAAITATDTAPCQNAAYTVVALSDNSGSDASMGQLSVPYWLGSDGTVQPGPGDIPVGTQIGMMVTSYNDGGQTASGLNAQLGVCATDPRVIPWGTYFTVPGYGTCYAADIGTWIQNDTVDVWLPGSQANGWGVQTFTVTIIANPYGASTPPPPPPTTPPPTTPPPTTTPPTTPPTTTPPPTTPPTTPPPTGTPCSPAWSSGTSYAPGDKVSYNGVNYTATYYSTDAEPDLPQSWNVWQSNGACT